MSGHRWLPVVPILILAIVLRVGYMPGAGHPGDLSIYGAWVGDIQRYGLPNIYGCCKSDYPPVYLALLAIVGAVVHTFAIPDRSPAFIFLLKIFPVAADLALIVVAYRWLRNEGRLRWIIPLVLAVHPAIIVDSAWWGQSDAYLGLFAVLTIIALNRRRLLAAWLFFTLGMLTKPHMVVLFPLLVILSFRRHGLRQAVIAVGVAGLMFVLVLTPFVIGGGMQRALDPYSGAVDRLAWITENAFNFWYLVTNGQGNYPSLTPELTRDSQIAIGPFTYKDIGLALLAMYTGVICVAMWREYDEPREAVWATALYLGFFMLPTQMHERYIYPAAVISVFAISQDRRMEAIAAGLMVTASYNIIRVAEPLYFLGVLIRPTMLGLYAALINCVLLIVLVRVVIRRGTFAPVRPSAAIGDPV